MLAQLRDITAAGGLFAGSFFVAWRLLLWLTGRFDKRQAQLDAEHDALDMSWKDYRLLLERDRQEQNARIEKIELQNRALRMAFEHTAGALIRLDPQNPALAIAERIMAQAFGEDFTVLAGRAESALDRAQEGRHDVA